MIKLHFNEVGKIRKHGNAPAKLIFIKYTGCVLNLWDVTGGFEFAMKI